MITTILIGLVYIALALGLAYLLVWIVSQIVALPAPLVNIFYVLVFLVTLIYVIQRHPTTLF